MTRSALIARARRLSARHARLTKMRQEIIARGKDPDHDPTLNAQATLFVAEAAEFNRQAKEWRAS